MRLIQYFSTCHWNLNSISAHDCSKLFLVRDFITLFKFDIICLSEIYLDSTAPTADEKLQIPWNNLTRSNSPSSIKPGRVCIYYLSSLSLRVIDIGYLHECLSFELHISDKFVICSHS